jgi:FMN phosphatase YigB (HAD superfamily)
MIRKKIDTLIVDLDNTLFDWLGLWHGSFLITYREIRELFGDVEADTAIRRIHREQRTSEYRFLVDELFASRPLEAARMRGRIELLLRESGIRDSAEPYKGVPESLSKIRSAGTKIVACTESMEFYSVRRLRALGLDGWIDDLFCNVDHPLSVEQSSKNLADLVPARWSTRIHHIEKGLSKPDPRVLSEVLDTAGCARERAAYVGDSLARDVAMAREVGVTDIHAKYGETSNRSEFELLSRVSHWTDADIQRESVALAKARCLEPSITLRSSFTEIFDFIQFERFGTSAITESVN